VKSLDAVPLFTDARYEDLTVGSRWGPFTDELDAEASAALRGAVGAGVPAADGWGGGRSTAANAPLGVLPLLTLRALRRALDGIIPGGVLIRQSFTVLDRLPAAGAVDIDVALTAQQRRPSGFYSTFAFTLSHAGAVRAAVEWMILAPPEEAAA